MHLIGQVAVTFVLICVMPGDHGVTAAAAGRARSSRAVAAGSQSFQL